MRRHAWMHPDLAEELNWDRDELKFEPSCRHYRLQIEHTAIVLFV